MNKDPKSNIHPRIIRVFISSTFRDMQKERDELVKFIFPQLRSLCEQRGVTWGEVDLRWGITDEQKAEGKVLSICLNEISHCRPYFIGMLGERYGWIPDEIPQELIAQEPWLKEHLNHSVTMLEILHGVLNNPDMAKHALFYFRDPKYLDTLPYEKRSQYIENAVDNEIEKYGLEEAQRLAEQRRRKLFELKEQIRKSGFPVYENYSSPKEFGQIVLKDMTAIIEALYPEGSQPNPLDRDAQEHEFFALSRAQVYIGRQEYFNRLDAHFQSDEQPLAVLGEPGSGKSALLANWAIRYKEQHPDLFVLMHFTGATPESTDWAGMLRRIMGEFKRRFNFQEEIPVKPDALRRTFANWLNMAAARERVLLILDALNQLDDLDGALDLVWLPPHIPGNVRIFLSTLPGRALEEIRKRAWPVMNVEPLLPAERKELIREYLGLSARALNTNDVEQISKAEQSKNPLFLRVLLDELRVTGVHESLGSQIEDYLRAESIPQLYERILARFETDYDRDRPNLVRDSLSMLWAARKGLSETELLEILGNQKQPLPRAYWSPLYLALENSLLSREGLISFSHEYLRKAIQNRFLPDEESISLTHIKLAEYFELRQGQPHRKVEELPWQWVKAKEWRRLYSLLSDLPFLCAEWDRNRFDIKHYWSLLENNTSFRMNDCYHFVQESPAKFISESWKICELYENAGYYDEAKMLQYFLVTYYQGLGDFDHLQACMNNLAGILRTLGEVDEAYKIMMEQENICYENKYLEGYAVSIGNLASIIALRDTEKALKLLKIQEKIYSESDDKEGLASCLNNQAPILDIRGDIDGAMMLYIKLEKLCCETGNVEKLEIVYGNWASLLIKLGDYQRAMELLKKKEQICRDLGNERSLMSSVCKQGVIKAYEGKFDEAMVLFRKAEKTYREHGYKKELSEVVGNIGNIYYQSANYNQAMEFYMEMELIAREVGDMKEVAISLLNQASTLGLRLGQAKKALVISDEAYRLAEKCGFYKLSDQIAGIRAEICQKLWD